MKSNFQENKHRCRPLLRGAVLCMSFYWLTGSIYAQNQVANSVSPHQPKRAPINNSKSYAAKPSAAKATSRAGAKKAVYYTPSFTGVGRGWRPRTAAGKPAPYKPPSMSQFNGGSTIIKPGGKSGQTGAASGKKPALAPGIAASAEGEQITLQSRDLSSYGPSWQSFSDYLTVAKDWGQIPLFLSFVNGANGNPRFQDVRISLAGKSLATIKDFSKQSTLTRNLTGAVGVGDSLLSVQVFGKAGSQLTWKFTTPKVVVSSISPKEVGVNDKITINGKNFSDHPTVNQVYFDKAKAEVISARPNQLVVKVPSVQGGKADLTVAVGPSRSTPFKVTLKGSPEIDSVDHISTAPGQPLTITGKGFSPVASENQVFFGSLPAEIVSCSANSITCIVPDPGNYPMWDIPITIKTRGMESKDPDKKGTINVQLRVF